MTKTIDYAYGTIQGARDYQEDSYGIFLDMDMQQDQYGNGDLLIVCDGMGGHIGGAAASKMVKEAFFDCFCDHDFAIPDCLSISLNAANKAVADHVAGHPDMEGMGTTLIAAVITGMSLYWISVGDSPLWLIRDGEISRLNKDHSMAPVLDKMAAMGEMSEEDALTDATRNQLRSAIVGEELSMIDLTTQAFDLLPGDCVILATDGVETVPREKIVSLIEGADQDRSKRAEVLLDAVSSFQDPHQDNATCVIASIPGEGKSKKSNFWQKLFGHRG